MSKTERSIYRKYNVIETSKTVNNSTIKWGKMPLCYFLPRKSWICQVLPFIVNRDTSPIGNIVLDGEFYWSTDRKSYSRLGIWNCISVWSADKFIRKLMWLCKNKSFLEKIFSLKDFLSRQKYKIQLSNATINNFIYKSDKNLEMFILAALLLLLTKAIF